MGSITSLIVKIMAVIGRMASLWRPRKTIPQAPPKPEPETPSIASQKAIDKSLTAAEAIVTTDSPATSAVTEPHSALETETKPIAAEGTKSTVSSPVLAQDQGELSIGARDKTGEVRPSIDPNEKEPLEQSSGERKRMGLEKRGPRRSRTSSPRETQRKSEKREPRPQIVCWKREREWVLAVELPDHFLEARQPIVLQDDKPLLGDETPEGCWRLAQLHGEVLMYVATAEGEREFKIALGAEDYLTFKLSGKDQNRGVRIKQPSSGSYLVIVPESWKREEELAGMPSVKPEPVCLDGYSAHFFEIEQGTATKIAFKDSAGHPISIGSDEPRFELVGQRIPDASELGPLFGALPPRIRIVDGNWATVGTIVLGEEGRGEGQWQMGFKPNTSLDEQNMPAEFMERKVGWYFLRFYNLQEELIDSLDFRFALGLKNITIQQNSVLPTTVGHQARTVEFEHNSDWCIMPLNSSAVNIECIGQKTLLTIPPAPDLDQTEWLVSLSKEIQVEVSILVERIWWAVGHEDSQPEVWTDKELPLTRADLRATSTKALWLRFPKKRWADSVLVGFSQAMAKHYRVLTMETIVAVPLRDLGEGTDIETVGEFLLHVWISHHEETLRTAVCKLYVRGSCKFCDFNTYNEEEGIAHVMKSHLDDLIPQLTYDELRDRIPDLPAKIYKCPYCSAYVSGDDPRNPTTAIDMHIRQACLNARRQGNSDRIHHRFHIIDDPDEIRKIVIGTLPHIKKCKLCSSKFENANQGMLRMHLIQNHKHDLFELR